MSTIKYPAVRVRLAGGDGNALGIVVAVTRALREARVPIQDIDAYRTEALSGDYGKVLQVTLSWVTVA